MNDKCHTSRSVTINPREETTVRRTYHVNVSIAKSSFLLSNDKSKHIARERRAAKAAPAPVLPCPRHWHQLHLAPATAKDTVLRKSAYETQWSGEETLFLSSFLFFLRPTLLPEVPTTVPMEPTLYGFIRPLKGFRWVGPSPIQKYERSFIFKACIAANTCKMATDWPQQHLLVALRREAPPLLWQPAKLRTAPLKPIWRLNSSCSWFERGCYHRENPRNPRTQPTDKAKKITQPIRQQLFLSPWGRSSPQSHALQSIVATPPSQPTSMIQLCFESKKRISFDWLKVLATIWATTNGHSHLQVVSNRALGGLCLHGNR